MPIGKDSITKRVAKPATNEEKIAPELVATAAAAPAPKKAPAKKTTTATADTEKKPAAKKSTTTAEKKPAAKKTASKKEIIETLTPPSVEPEVSTGVLSNVSPETVAAVIGHKEDEKYEKVRIGQKMPDFLL